MAHLETYVNELIRQIDSTTTAKKHIEVPLPEIKFHPVDWLSSQVIYPQFYWQSRDKREEVVALGQVATFIELAPAYLVLQPDQRIWGGRAFEYDSQEKTRCPKSFYFLPQIELIRRESSWFLAVNVANDPEQTIQALRNLSFDYTPLASIATQVDHVSHTPSRPEWFSAVDSALRAIDETMLEKVVLARESEVTLTQPITAFQLLKTSLANNDDSYHFLFSMDARQQFIGASPERLYRRVGRNIETEAVAGTIGRGSTTQEDTRLAHWLVNDQKNLNENQLVVDDIEQRLKPHCESIMIEQRAQLLPLRRVQHLQRAIQAVLDKDVPKFAVLDALQPTAAVAGLPRSEAMAFINQHEQFHRGWYSGSVGYISPDRAEFSVAIRSALFMNGALRLYAGAGIVPGSDPSHEWTELDKKASTLLSLIVDTTLEVAS